MRYCGGTAGENATLPVKPAAVHWPCAFTLARSTRLMTVHVGTGVGGRGVGLGVGAGARVAPGCGVGSMISVGIGARDDPGVVGADGEPSAIARLGSGVPRPDTAPVDCALFAGPTMAESGASLVRTASTVTVATTVPALAAARTNPDD